MESNTEIKDAYFRRFFVPFIISLLVIVGAAVIIATPQGLKTEWETFNTALGKTVGGAFRRK